MRYHKTHLSRRLILELVADQEKEEMLVSKFRVSLLKFFFKKILGIKEAGMPVDFVNKLFRMLQDIEVNKDLNSAFKKSLDTSNNNNCKHMAGRNFVDLMGNGTYAFFQECLNVKILNAGAWSRSKDRSHLTLPRELEDLVPEVEDFYKKKHTGRKLNWAHHWSTGTVGIRDCSHSF